MGGTGVIDNFLGVFTQYIDSGFGLVQGDVRWLAGVLIGIDITLAGLLWAMAPDEDVLARLIKKTLYIGVFAFIIGNYNNLAQIIYNSFAGLGIEASGGTMSQAQLLQPGRVAQVGVTAGQPILTAISGLMGFASFFDNFVQIAILLLAWVILVISFFIMAIQLFVSLIEFKLTTLGRLRPRSLRPFRAHRLSGGEGVGQRRLVGREDSRARRDRRHRLDNLRPIHQRPEQSPDDHRRADSDPRGLVDARPHDLRARHCQRPHRRRPAAWRWRGRRNGYGGRRRRLRRSEPGGGRHRRSRQRDRGRARTSASVVGGRSNGVSGRRGDRKSRSRRGAPPPARFGPVGPAAARVRRREDKPRPDKPAHPVRTLQANPRAPVLRRGCGA